MNSEKGNKHGHPSTYPICPCWMGDRWVGIDVFQYQYHARHRLEPDLEGGKAILSRCQQKCSDRDAALQASHTYATYDINFT